MKKNRNYCRYIDCDYVAKLALADAEYLAQFLKEYYLGDKFEKPILNDLRPSYRRRHAERRDVSTTLADIQSHDTIDFLTPVQFSEDVLIEAIDLMNERNKK